MKSRTDYRGLRLPMLANPPCPQPEDPLAPTEEPIVPLRFTRQCAGHRQRPMMAGSLRQPHFGEFVREIPRREKLFWVYPARFEKRHPEIWPAQ